MKTASSYPVPGGFFRWSLGMVILLVAQAVHAQNPGQPPRSGYRFSNTATEPVFRSREDSVQHTRVNEMIRQEMQRPKVRKILVDSLSRELDRIMREGIVGSRTVYFGSADFVRFHDLGQHRPDTIRRLTLDHYTGSRLPKEIFQCTQLEELEILNTQLWSLQSLRRLPALKRIIILNNRSPRPLRLSRSKTVEVVTARTSHPESLPRHYGALRQLQRLDLSRCELKKFPRLDRPKALREVVLVFNQLTLEEPPAKFSDKVERINLQYNRIESVPAWISKFRGLRKLDFNNNQISQVDPALGTLRLESIGFYRNKLKQVPAALFAMDSLKEVDLYYNDIETLPDDISQWRRLQRLYLSYNKLYKIPEALGTLTSLRELYLHDNRLFQLPESLSKLDRLVVLRINNNLFSDFPASIPALTALENLDVSRNQLETVPEALYSLRHLKILSLVANKWDEPTRGRLAGWADQLRMRQVVVHLNSFDESE
ncbi:MAG: leucine-rich repeat domain-containing protein [Cyclobacteriaceae bacterium]|nr:leucine-rich repeat domain-containing protein [Cyclobacteriaceae bacterium]